MSNDSLGDRMKGYEKESRVQLKAKKPVIGRLDGRAFHTFTRGLDRPWDQGLIRCMEDAAKYLCENVQGCRVAYVQSDEISILLTDWEKEETQGWFNYKVEKMASVGASLVTGAFTSSFYQEFEEFQKDFISKNKIATFDARFFSIPKDEVNNYFHWRQADAIRNSVQMLARSYFSHRECYNKNNNQLKEILLSKGVCWDDEPINHQRGSCVVKVNREEDVIFQKNGEEHSVKVIRNKWELDRRIPLFVENKDYINSLVY